MKMNLSSTIVLNKIPEQFYRPRTAVGPVRDHSL